MASLKHVLEDINRQIGLMEVFKYKTSDLLYILTDSADRYAIEATFRDPKDNHSKNSIKTNLVISHIGYAYRQILKFIYRFSSEDGKPANIDYIQESFIKLLRDMFLYYNEVRNRIDRNELGDIILDFDDVTKTVIEQDSNIKRRTYIRASEYNNLSNDSINFKFSCISWFMNNKTSVKNFKYMQYFHSTFDKSSFDTLFEIVLKDSEIKEDIDFGDFKYFDVVRTCAAINYIALFKLTSNFSNAFLTRDSNFFYEQSYDVFIKHLHEISGVDLEVIKLIVNYMVYKPEYQSDKLTLLQHFLLINGKIVFSPFVIIPAELPKKFVKIVRDLESKKYEVVFSRIAKSKEVFMINEIVYNYSVNPLAYVTPNVKYQLPNSNNISAEYDLVFYDSSNKTLYLCECKWFNVADGESENMKVNKKIRNTMLQRIKKDELAVNNKTHFIETIFGGSIEVDDIKSFVISYTHMGDDHNDYILPVIDLGTFRSLSVQFNFDITKVYECIKNQCFLDSYDTEVFSEEFEYFGYKFKINRLAIKKL